MIFEVEKVMTDWRQ